MAPSLGLHRAEARALSNDRSGQSAEQGIGSLVNVPLLDLVAQYRTIKDDVLRAVMAVVERQGFIMGPEVAQLEAEIARGGQAFSHMRHDSHLKMLVSGSSRSAMRTCIGFGTGCRRAAISRRR